LALCEGFLIALVEKVLILLFFRFLPLCSYSGFQS
jgi:hypothetical protein